MKYCSFFLLFLLLSLNVNAQNFSNTGSGLNDLSRFMDDSTSNEVVAADEDEDGDANGAEINDPLSAVEMNVTDSVITFENLPDKGSMMAHITNTNGEEIFARSLNARKRSIRVHRLPNDLFYVTLVYKSDRKAFELNRAEKETKSQKNKPAQ